MRCDDGCREEKSNLRRVALGLGWPGPSCDKRVRIRRMPSWWLFAFKMMCFSLHRLFDDNLPESLQVGCTQEQQCCAAERPRHNAVADLGCIASQLPHEEKGNIVTRIKIPNGLIPYHPVAHRTLTSRSHRRRPDSSASAISGIYVGDSADGTMRTTRTSGTKIWATSSTLFWPRFLLQLSSRLLHLSSKSYGRPTAANFTSKFFHTCDIIWCTFMAPHSCNEKNPGQWDSCLILVKRLRQEEVQSCTALGCLPCRVVSFLRILIIPASGSLQAYLPHMSWGLSGRAKQGYVTKHLLEYCCFWQSRDYGSSILIWYTTGARLPCRIFTCSHRLTE